MIASAVLVTVLAGLLAVFVNCIFLNELNRRLTLAYSAVEAEMETIKNTPFANLDALNGTTFNLNGFTAGDAIGRIEVSNEGSSDVKRVRITASFRNRKRIIGEDKNLNGALDTGEDVDLNDELNSPVELITLITR